MSRSRWKKLILKQVTSNENQGKQLLSKLTELKNLFYFLIRVSLDDFIGTLLSVHSTVMQDFDGASNLLHDEKNFKLFLN